MNTRPKVLIFDDEIKWAKQIALSLKYGFDTMPITKRSDWNACIGSTYWDAIVVDVQILGSDTNGLEMTEKSILEHEITAPVIVISITNLKEAKRKHGRVFFGYVHKDNYNKELPALVERACKPLERSIYLRGMLTEFARRFGVLLDTFPDSMADYNFARKIIEGTNGKTIKDLIEVVGGTKHELTNMARIVLQIIQWAKEKKEC